MPYYSFFGVCPPWKNQAFCIPKTHGFERVSIMLKESLGCHKPVGISWSMTQGNYAAFSSLFLTLSNLLGKGSWQWTSLLRLTWCSINLQPTYPGGLDSIIHYCPFMRILILLLLFIICTTVGSKALILDQDLTVLDPLQPQKERMVSAQWAYNLSTPWVHFSSVTYLSMLP